MNQGRAYRVLVVIRSAGDGLTASLAAETAWRTGRRKEFVPRGMCAAQGKLFAPDGCSHKARGIAVPPPGFTTSQGRAWADRPRKVTGLTRHPRRTAVLAYTLTLARSCSPTTGQNASRPERRQHNAGVQWKLCQKVRRAGEHPSVTFGRPNASIEDGTLLRNQVQQAVAQASVLPIVAGTNSKTRKRSAQHCQCEDVRD